MSVAYFISLFSCLLVVIVALLPLCTSNNNLCKDDERQALLEFKHGLVDEANRLASWAGPKTDCCTWTGIFCDNSTGHVQKIHLPNNCYIDVITTLKHAQECHKQRLSVNISPSLLHLKQLKHLDLSHNDFKGIQIPSFIGSFKSLRYLNLSRSGFGGTVPPQLGNLSELHTLCLGSFYPFVDYEFENTLTSTRNMHWLSSLSGLHLLDMSGVDLSKTSDNWLQILMINCALSSPVLDSLHNLTSLLSLDLSKNELTKTIPKSLANLCNLRHIKLEGNSFPNISLATHLESFFECKEPRLESLSLGSSELSDSIGLLSSLKSLDLQNNHISGPIPYSVGKLSSLEMLDLSYNQLNGSLPSALGQLSKLVLLDFSNNRLTGVVTKPHFVKLERLIILNGEGNNLTLRSNLTNRIPSFQLIILSLPNLDYLDISQNHIQGILPTCIPPSLRVLDISSNEVGGPLPQLPNTSRTLIMDLSNNYFTGSLHNFLCPENENELGVLNLSHNHLSGVVPDCWQKWQSLSFLNLANNNLSGRIPTSLGSLSSLGSLNLCNNNLSGSLKILDLADNNLSGNIPTCFNNFSVLTGKQTTSNSQLDFSPFQGNDALGSASLVIKGREDTYSTILGLVMILDLSGNNFSGHIPTEIMALKALRSLNLSRNHLTGRIPENIGDLRLLESLDLSVNLLSGELPVSLSNLSFLSDFSVSHNSLTGRVPSSTQLQGFNESSFLGNKLCGYPLTISCAVEVTDKEDIEEGNNGSDGVDWGLIISIVFGFITSFWAVLTPLIVSTKWRIAYFGFLTELRSMVCDVIRMYWCSMFYK
ncbi:hypothetical protein LXL04_012101 [Taraxacum kok-saghyz]